MSDSLARRPDVALAPGNSGPWRILVVEDESIFARAVATCLQRAGHACSVAGTLMEARDRIAAGPDALDLVLLDVRLPDGESFELLSEIAHGSEGAPTVLVMTAYGDVGQAVQAMKRGAADYLKKPIDLDELLVTVDKVMRSARLRSRLNLSQARESRAGDGAALIGESSALREARRQIEAMAAIAGDSPPTVLILGETGTGKDVAARVLHRLSSRSDRPFVHIDCTALPKEMMEAELFGHVRGAFTSAHVSRAGLIEAAEDGTAFLDEIGELPLPLQAKLLNVLERRQLRRVGSTREVPVPVRFVAATNRNLSAMLSRGEFRDDLYFRLNVLTVSLPPLRSCRQDIPLLARHFVDVTARAYGRAAPALHDDAIAALAAYEWPGNVRELKNVIERSVLLSDSSGISAQSLRLAAPAAASRAAQGRGAEAALPTLAGAEQEMIAAALANTGGNTSEAARRLGITRMALRYRMEKYGIRPTDFGRGSV